MWLWRVINIFCLHYIGLVLHVSVAFPLISPLFHTLYYQFKGVFWWWQNSISVPLTTLGPLHSWFFSHPSFTLRGYCYLLNWLKVYNYVYVIFMYAWKFVFSDWGSGLQFMCVACSWLGRCHCMVRFFFNGTICCLAYNSSDTFTGNPLTPGSVEDLPSPNSSILAQRKGGENYFQFTGGLVEKHQINKLTTIFHCL